MIKVSIIITTYNTEKYLTNCLESVINQTLRDIEIICIDDCSTDKTINILRNFQKKDSRIKIIQMDKNRGCSYSRNIGIINATGEYVAFIDGDDVIDYDFYEKLYNNAIKNNADISKGELLKIYPNKTEKIESNESIKKYKYCFNREFTTAIFKNSFLKENNIMHPEDVRTSEDIAFAIHAALKTNKIVFCGSTYYHYIQHPGSKVRTFNENVIKSLLNCAKYILNLLNETNLKEADYKYIVKNTVIAKIIWRFKRANLTKDQIETITPKIIEEIKPLCKYEINELENLNYETFLQGENPIKYTLLENIFSIKNDNDKKHKILTMLGIHIKFKNIKGVR